ncbi:MAG: hypothetical protein LKI53_06675 [Bacteroidales bacterium]|jgi:hypothetical protein|nr:hypothetical protein [Bacteroidales bacterium]
MKNFDELFKNLKEEALNLAESTFKNYKDAAKSDTSNFLENMKENLKNWSSMVLEKKMSKEEASDLILNNAKELSRMMILKQSGIAKIELDKFSRNLVELIIKIIISAL